MLLFFKFFIVFFIVDIIVYVFKDNMSYCFWGICFFFEFLILMLFVKKKIDNVNEDNILIVIIKKVLNIFIWCFLLE